MTKIALLCPTRGRSKQLHRMMQSALDTSQKDTVKVYIGLSDDDSNEPIFATGGIYGGSKIYPANLPTVHKWNDLAQMALQDGEAKLFMLAADDMIFETAGWDKALIEHYEALKEKVHVYSLRDSRDAVGFPHPIVSREYVDAMGYFIPPIFLHWFADTWTNAIGRANGCFTHLDSYLLIHDKPSDRGQPDDTHNRIRSWGWRERDKYVNDTCEHFLEYEKLRLDNYLRKREEA